jgi:hypothetical protein
LRDLSFGGEQYLHRRTLSENIDDFHTATDITHVGQLDVGDNLKVGEYLFSKDHKYFMKLGADNIMSVWTFENSYLFKLVQSFNVNQ